MWRPDYYIRYVTLPSAIEGVTLPNDDGSFDIYINSSICPKRQRKKLKHEIEHIQQDHFYSEAPVVAIESAANGKPLVYAPKRRSMTAPTVRVGFPTKTIPLFESLDQFADFMNILRKRGRCGDYVLVSTPEEASISDNPPTPTHGIL